MKVQISEKESYWVIFKYKRKMIPYISVNNKFNNPYALAYKEDHFQGDTYCYVYDDSVQGKPVQVAEGLASCGKKDRFVKETGRQIAFDRAINSLFKEDEVRKDIFRKIYFSRKDYLKTDKINTVRKFKGGAKFPNTKINKTEIYEQ